MPVIQVKTTILILCLLVGLCPVLAIAETKAQAAPDLDSHQVIAADEIVDSVAEETLAMNDAVTPPEKSLKEVVADKGPVLLVPMVLVILALVAVSRRKEHD